MPDDPKPNVRRRVLGTNLRRLREGHGYLLEHAAEQLSCNISKISRIESGRSPIRPLDLKALLDLYEVRDATTRDGWLSLARESRKKRWWRVLEDRLPQDFLDLIGLEEDTSKAEIESLWSAPASTSSERPNAPPTRNDAPGRPRKPSSER
jgi:transcriptional regulator with XRE-family HTH domain